MSEYRDPGAEWSGDVRESQPSMSDEVNRQSVSRETVIIPGPGWSTAIGWGIVLGWVFSFLITALIMFVLVVVLFIIGVGGMSLGPILAPTPTPTPIRYP